MRTEIYKKFTVDNLLSQEIDVRSEIGYLLRLLPLSIVLEDLDRGGG